MNYNPFFKVLVAIVAACFAAFLCTFMVVGALSMITHGLT